MLYYFPYSRCELFLSSGHPWNFVEYHSMGVLLVLCHYRLHPHSEWSSMHSGAKVYGCSMRAVLLSPLLLKIKYKFFSIAGLIYPIREAPLKIAPPLFGHCPNSDCPPPPRPQKGTLGHFFPGRFQRLCQITILRVCECHKESWQALNPLLTKENT